MSPVPDDQAERRDHLVSLGVDEKAAKTASQTGKSYNVLVEALTVAGIAEPPGATEVDARKKVTSLIYTATTKFSDKKLVSKGVRIADEAKELTFRAIGDGRIRGMINLESAVSWLGSLYSSGSNAVDAGADEVSLDVAEFEKAAGVGVVIDPADVAAEVKSRITENKADILESRYRYNSAPIQLGIMNKFKFVEGKEVRALILSEIESLLGPKTEADLAKPEKRKKAKAPKPSPAGAPNSGGNDSKGGVKVESNGPLSGGLTDTPADPFAGIPTSFHARDLKSARNSAGLIEKRRMAVGEKVMCRFPPEPNGYLHIGHAKAMFIDFGFAKKSSGETILRFDDTNPTAEKDEYVHSIIEMVEWMGHKPSRVTYSSDYFDELFELAKELIRRGKAYVCHQSGDEIKKGRETMTESPFRNRSVSENLREFEKMRRGVYEEGAAVLRMKIDMTSTNLVLRDPVAYRVLHTPHARTGDKWCVYPSYDYTHCIVDSLEWVTHSLCTLEFEVRRDSYYWLLEALDLYRPFVWEFARLSLEFTMMSKRKLKELVERGIVSGWDDPRMPTLSGMRRRGYPASAINAFCSAVGASRAPNMIGLHVLEHFVRSELDRTCRRAFAVLRPLKVVITNFRGEEELKVANHPKNESMGKRDMLLTRNVFIEQTDFRMVDEKGYYGLAPGKTAMLRYAYPVTVDEVVLDDDGTTPVELRVTMDYEKSVKPKGVLHWANTSALEVEVRLFSTLFRSSDPASLKSEWLEDINPAGREVLSKSLVEPFLGDAKIREAFQFERTGYFAVDDDAASGRPVFNMVVSLRDSRPVS